MRFARILLAVSIFAALGNWTNAQDRTIEVVGRLVKPHPASGIDSPFVLVDKFSAIRFHVRPAENVDLAPFHDRWVVLQGQPVFGRTPQVRHLVVTDVAPSSTNRNRQHPPVRRHPASSGSPAEPKVMQTSARQAQPNFVEAGPEAYAEVESSACIEDACSSCGMACRPGGWFLRAEWLYWKPRRRSLDVAIVDPNIDDAPEGPFESLLWDNESGIRYGFGWRHCDGWDLALYHTYLEADTRLQTSAAAGGQLWTSLTHPENTFVTATSADAFADLDYNVLDLELGRWIKINDCSELRLFAGGRYGWIDQDLGVVYDDGGGTLTEVLSPIDFEGGGIRVGGEYYRHFLNHWMIFARASGSLLVGEFDAALRETTDGGATTVADVQESYEAVVPVTELAVGISFRRGPWTLSAGYEISNWQNLVDSRSFVDDVHEGKSISTSGDLSLDGIFVQGGLGW